MAKEIDIKLKTSADPSGVQIISGSLKGLKATAAEVSSNVILSARQINERWREYWRSTRENATKELSQVSTAAQKEGAKINGVFAKLFGEMKTGAVWAVGAKLVSGFGDLVRKTFEGVRYAVQESFKFETAVANFKTLTGSIEEARRHVDELRQFAASNPLTFDDVAKASKTLLSFGISVNEVMPSLKVLGDISMGNSEKFKALALAFGQCKSAGRLMGQDLLQMINQGFNPLTVIAQETGRSMAELKDIMSEGGISFEMVAAAFQKATEEGGLFHDALKNASETGDGMMAKMKDTWDTTVRNVGDAFSDTAKEGIGKVTTALKELNEDGTIERWAEKSTQSLDGLIKVLSATGNLLGNIYQYSGAKDLVNFGHGLIEGVGGSAGAFIGTLMGGGSIGDAFRESDAQFMENFRTQMADGFYWKDTEYAQWLESQKKKPGKPKGGTDKPKGGTDKPKGGEDDEIVLTILDMLEAMEAKKAQERAEKEAAKAQALAEKAAKARERAEIKAAQEAARERERLEREAHKQRMDNLRELIAAETSRGGALRSVSASAQSEFDRAFAMYRDPTLAAAQIGEEKDYQNDLAQLHKDAARYGGKWRIDELSRLMAAGDSQGITDTLTAWRKNRNFTPQLEAMVRASAAEKTKTTAEDELRKIEHNTANLAAKLQELLTMKG
jgi:tape measure domain-containing protein